MGLLVYTNPHLYIVIGVSVLNGFLLCIIGYKFLQIIQLTGYKLKGFFSWAKQTKGNYLIRIAALSVLSFMCMLAINTALVSMKISSYYGYISLIFYLYFALYFAAKLRGVQPSEKTPLKYTRRMTRLVGMLMFIGTVFTFGLFLLSYVIWGTTATSLIGLSPLGLLILVPLSFYFMLPFEAINNQNFVRLAKKKLKRMEKNRTLYKIGITGSYAKTTTKNILATILSEKYSVCSSPASFNTPMGLTKTVLKYLYNEHNVLIVEMGARRVGDIKRLCSIIKPDIAIMTSIGNQHLASFKSVDAIKQTKYEIVKALPALGFAVFNGESELLNDLYDKTIVEKVQTGFDEKFFVYAKDVKVSAGGTEFLLCTDGGKYKAQTKLLGKHNIENILMAAAVAIRMRVAPKDIVAGIAKLTPTPHRLELITSDSGVTVLDDSYNSNTKGTRVALDVLSLFEGSKFVATPGIVELGQEQFSSNKEFGKAIASVADGAFVINEINRKAIVEGLKEGGMTEEKIVLCKNLEEAKNKFAAYLKSGDVILLENDLPDSFK